MSTLSTQIPPQDEIAALISRHAPRNGDYVTAIGNLTFHRRSSVTEALFHAARPSVAIIAQGAKDVTLGTETFHYSRMQYLLTSVDLPVQVRVAQASEQQPRLKNGHPAHNTMGSDSTNSTQLWVAMLNSSNLCPTMASSVTATVNGSVHQKRR